MKKRVLKCICDITVRILFLTLNTRNRVQYNYHALLGLPVDGRAPQEK